jgi:hypothetical protein
LAGPEVEFPSTDWNLHFYREFSMDSTYPRPRSERGPLFTMGYMAKSKEKRRRSDPGDNAVGYRKDTLSEILRQMKWERPAGRSHSLFQDAEPIPEYSD